MAAVRLLKTFMCSGERQDIIGSSLGDTMALA